MFGRSKIVKTPALRGLTPNSWLSNSKSCENWNRIQMTPDSFKHGNLLKQIDPLKKYNIKSIGTKSTNMSELMVNFAMV